MAQCTRMAMMRLHPSTPVSASKDFFPGIFLVNVRGAMAQRMRMAMRRTYPSTPVSAGQHSLPGIFMVRMMMGRVEVCGPILVGMGVVPSGEGGLGSAAGRNW